MQITMQQFLALNNVEKAKVLKAMAEGKIKII